LHQFLRVSDWEHAEDDSVDEGEDGGVGADTESESEDGNGGVYGRIAKRAQGVTDVLEKGFEEGDAASVATLFFGAFEAAEFAARAAEGFVAGDAVAVEIVSVGFQMEAEFGVHVVLRAGAMEIGVEPGTESGEESHEASGDVVCEVMKIKGCGGVEGEADPSLRSG
jgi:hypothetical protein